MESVEEFVRRLGLDECPAKTLAVEMVEADRGATRLALLEEIMSEGKRRYCATGGGSVGHTHDVVAELLAKHRSTQPVQPTKGGGEKL